MCVTLPVREEHAVYEEEYDGDGEPCCICGKMPLGYRMYGTSKYCSECLDHREKHGVWSVFEETVEVCD